MQYGLFMMPMHLPEKPLAQAIDEDIEYQILSFAIHSIGLEVPCNRSIIEVHNVTAVQPFHEDRVVARLIDDGCVFFTFRIS